MRFYHHLSALAVLAGPIAHVFATRTIEQLVLAIEELQNSVNQANDYADSIDVLNDVINYHASFHLTNSISISADTSSES